VIADFAVGSGPGPSEYGVFGSGTEEEIDLFANHHICPRLILIREGAPEGSFSCDLRTRFHQKTLSGLYYQYADEKALLEVLELALPQLFAEVHGKEQLPSTADFELGLHKLVQMAGRFSRPRISASDLLPQIEHAIQRQIPNLDSIIAKFSTEEFSTPQLDREDIALLGVLAKCSDAFRFQKDRLVQVQLMEQATALALSIGHQEIFELALQGWAEKLRLGCGPNSPDDFPQILLTHLGDVSNRTRSIINIERAGYIQKRSIGKAYSIQAMDLAHEALESIAFDDPLRIYVLFNAALVNRCGLDLRYRYRSYLFEAVSIAEANWGLMAPQDYCQLLLECCFLLHGQEHQILKKRILHAVENVATPNGLEKSLTLAHQFRSQSFPNHVDIVGPLPNKQEMRMQIPFGDELMPASPDSRFYDLFK
jgi:hypothetical protein